MRKILLIAVSIYCAACSPKQDRNGDRLEVPNRNITVDGETDDWESVPAVQVRGKDHLWIGEGLPEGQWAGDHDLGFAWRAAWDEGKLFFLFEVRDDTLSDFGQEYSWLNDCIEIHLDPQKVGGNRIEGIGSDHEFEDRLGKHLRGYEMQFLPSNPPKVFVNDAKGVYYTDADQTADFRRYWQGEVAARKTEQGYLLETGFIVPGSDFQSGHKLGLDVAVCDDDGPGRKSLMLWSGYQGEFWLRMDNFKTVVLR